MILSVNNISKAFSDTPVLDGVSFLLEEREKAALIGINGSGKTTLLRIITGGLSPDSGEVTFKKDTAYGYLAQYQERSADCTVYEDVLTAKADVLRMEREIRALEAKMRTAGEDLLENLMDRYSRLTQEFDRINGYAWESEVRGILNGLGFGEEDYDRGFNTLSGGQKTRVTLGRLLLEKPELLILDEPTNHLDIESVSWLENYLKNYPGAVLIVSHDRYFLDRLVGKVYDLENGRLTTYIGNYSQYAEKKELQRHAAMAAYLNQQREIKHQEEVITRLKSFNREKSIRRAESREKKLEKIERIEKPVDINDSMNFTLEPNITSGTDVLMVDGLSKAYDGRTLFSDVSFLIRRGEHVAVIGANGTGKTTLMKIINGIVKPDSGSVRLGSKVEVGYYDQEQQRLTEDHRVFDEIRDTYPYLNDTTIRKTLAAFLFTGEAVFKQVSDLSGGERGRLSLAKLILSPCNFLILDEPTNHLDMASKEILESALSRYTGTILTVSHDRYFINRTADRILELTGAHFAEYHGNYDYYVEKKAQAANPSAAGRPMPALSVFGKASPQAGQGTGKATPQAGQGTGKAASQTGQGSGKITAQAGQGSGILMAQGGQGSGVSGSGLSSNADGSGSRRADSADGASMWRQQKEEQAKERKRANDIKRLEDMISSIEERNAQIDELLTQEEVFTNAGRLLELSKEREEGQNRIDELFEELELMEQT